MTTEFLEFLEQYKPIIDKALNAFLPPDNTYPETLHKAMRYTVMAGGKRLRPLLTLAGSKIAAGIVEPVLPTACALEMIHTYSMIHDDLPCMDDDDFRRGRPTAHKVFGEAVAILVGDALLTVAFEIIASNANQPDIIKENIPKVIATVAQGAGSKGMVGGQAIDIELEGKEFDVPTLQYLHTHKTGALITASVIAGAMLVSDSDSTIKALKNYGHRIGLAFQIVDDILDITSDRETLGKSIGKDIEQNKATYPSVFGIEESKQIAQQLLNEAKDELLPFKETAATLTSLADYILERTY